MSKKRRDTKGHVLNRGESQRKDGSYQYRYTTANGKRQTVYASDLNSLRVKEKEIADSLHKGIDYAAGSITVRDMVKKYLFLHRGLKQSTKEWHEQMIKLLDYDGFGDRAIKNIKVSDAQAWLGMLSENGKSYSSLSGLKGILKPAFELACRENVISSNPFAFKITEIAANDSRERHALTLAEQQTWLDFVKNDPSYAVYYDWFVILLGTGLRISEFCGLTMHDIDWQNQKIHVQRQLLRDKDRRLYTSSLKTQKGKRDIPMTEDVAASLRNVIAARPKMNVAFMLDGCRDFLFITRDGTPHDRGNIANTIKRIKQKYDTQHTKPFPNISPHILRHTFCTNMTSSGMTPKDLQYIMGHADIRTTLGKYAHTNAEQAAAEMARIEKQRKALVR